MFTGIIQEIGIIKQVSQLSGGLEVTLKASAVISELNIGDSIAINGVCSTVIKFGQDFLCVQYSEETLSKSTISNVKNGDIANLELCLTPNSRLGGHYVTGHVDCTGKIKSIKKTNEWAVFEIGFPKSFKKFLIPKGSITIDGISLTVVDLNTEAFTCHLIPHTIMHTSLNHKKTGEKVNLEFDVLGKYFYSFYLSEKEESKEKDSNLKKLLYEKGFM
jgi:riboflavin synthase